MMLRRPGPIGLTLLAALAACSPSDSDPLTTDAVVGALAPTTRFATLDGDTASIADLAGRVAVVNFWGTWCVPCRREIPELVALDDAYRSRGVEIVGVAVESGEPDDIRSFMSEFGATYRLWMTDTATALSVFEAVGYPFTLVVDREGRVVEAYLGPQSYETLATRIEGLLEGDGALTDADS